jgi:hypothetical protein
VTGQPGDGCPDPRAIHPHWCGFCGAQLMFTPIQCRSLIIIPPCSRCGEKQWRNEIDELTAPDYREAP